MAFYHPDLVYEGIMYNVSNQSSCKIILSKLSQESIYIHLKEKGSNGDYLSMLDMINPKKCNQEMSEVSFLKKCHQWFLKGFGFWPLILVGNTVATYLSLFPISRVLEKSKKCSI